MIGLIYTSCGCFNKAGIISSWDSNSIIAICAIIVSIVGLGLSTYFNRMTLRHTQTHDKLTTEPHLAIRNNVTKSVGNKLILKNCGFGPAIIKDIYFLYKNIKYNQIDDLYFENFKPLIGFVKESTFYMFDKNEVLGAEESINLSELTIKDGFDFTSFRIFLKDVKIKVVYNNIYNDECLFELALMNKNANN